MVDTYGKEIRSWEITGFKTERVLKDSETVSSIKKNQIRFMFDLKEKGNDDNTKIIWFHMDVDGLLFDDFVNNFDLNMKNMKEAFQDWE